MFYLTVDFVISMFVGMVFSVLLWLLGVDPIINGITFLLIVVGCTLTLLFIQGSHRLSNRERDSRE